jgi:hypothetical protein
MRDDSLQTRGPCRAPIFRQGCVLGSGTPMQVVAKGPGSLPFPIIAGDDLQEYSAESEKKYGELAVNVKTEKKEKKNY